MRSMDKDEAKNNDPLLYAGLLNSLLPEKGGGWHLLGGDLMHLTHWLINSNKSRKMTQDRIEHLQNQVTGVKHLIAESQIKTAGRQLDKLR